VIVLLVHHENELRCWIKAHSFPSLINNDMHPPINILVLDRVSKVCLLIVSFTFVIAAYINVTKSYFYETKSEDKSTCMYPYHIVFLFE
jgi:hypothetical protein